LRKAEYLSSMSIDVKAPGAARKPRRAPAPRSSSDEDWSWPPRIILSRKWRTRRPSGERVNRRTGLRSHRGDNILRNRIGIDLLRQFEEAFFEGESAKARFHFVDGAGGDDLALFEDGEVGAEAVGLLEDGGGEEKGASTGSEAGDDVAEDEAEVTSRPEKGSTRMRSSGSCIMAVLFTMLCRIPFEYDPLRPSRAPQRVKPWSMA